MVGWTNPTRKWGRPAIIVTDTNYWNNVTHIYDTVDRLTGFPATFGIRASARF